MTAILAFVGSFLGALIVGSTNRWRGANTSSVEGGKKTPQVSAPPPPAEDAEHAEPESAPRSSPDPDRKKLIAAIVLSPAATLLAGVIVDRVRESYASETVTAWLVMLGFGVVALVSRWAGYRALARYYLFALVTISYVLTELFMQSPGHQLPTAWAVSGYVSAFAWSLALLMTVKDPTPSGVPHWVLVAGNLIGFHYAGFSLGPYLAGLAFYPLDDHPRFAGSDIALLVAGIVTGLIAMLALTTEIRYRAAWLSGSLGAFILVWQALKFESFREWFLGHHENILTGLVLLAFGIALRLFWATLSPMALEMVTRINKVGRRLSTWVDAKDAAQREKSEARAAKRRLRREAAGPAEPPRPGDAQA